MSSRNILLKAIAFGIFISAGHPAYSSEGSWRVCAVGQSSGQCDFAGDNGIQQAVDQASPGDTIVIAPGVYTPRLTRDIPHQDVMVRGYVVIDAKTLTITAEPGAIIMGKGGVPACAVLVHKSTVQLNNLTISDFNYGIEEDDIYDGHGVFIIDSKVKVSKLDLSRVQKMAVSTHGDSVVELQGVTSTDGHLGLWANENSSVTVRDSMFSVNDSAGVAAYDEATVTIATTRIEFSEDDGVYAADSARVTVSDSIIVNNAPYGLNAGDSSKISIDKSYVADNDVDYSAVESGGNANITVGARMLLAPPAEVRGGIERRD